MRPLTSPRRLIAAVAGVAILTTGCADLRGEREFTDDQGRTYEPVRFEEPAASTDEEARTEPPTRIAVAEDAEVPAAFAFTAATTDGAMTSGRDLLGTDGTVITFLQPTCEFSTEEAPKLAAAARRHADLRFVLAFSGGDVADYEAMLDAAGLDLPNVIAVDDSSLALWNRFAVTASPSTLLVDADLRLRSSYGALGDDGLDRAAGFIAEGFATSA